MSAPLKVYTRPDNPGHCRPSPQGCYVEPAILVPIDDESLPHPGDGKVWMRHGDPVEILSVPATDCAGNARVMCRYVEGGGLTIQYSEDLRERKPEHEHRPWCEWKGKPPGCTCKRRSGEDRRKRERRKNTTARDMAGGRRQEWARGAAVIEIKHRRSGCDRRSS